MNPLKKEFPIFTNQPTLAYLDSAANTFCPRTVLRAQADYYEKYPANVARGLYPLSIEATEKYQAARSAVAEYLEVSPEEVIFTAGATMSAGMIAHGLRKTLSRGQNILLSRAEHHANFLPWWEVAREIGAEVRLLELDADGFADPEDLRRKLDDRSAVLALTHASNVLGGVNPVKELFTLAREIAPQIITVLDASQSIAHGPLSLPEAGCDFLFFSGHKVYAPGGTGVLAGRAEKLRLLSPLLYGGEMVATVGEKEIVYKDIPARLEAGTPHIAGAVALAEALSFLRNLGWKNLRRHELSLLEYALEKLREIPELVVYGPAEAARRIGLISFHLPSVHPHDIAEICASENVAIRAGTHCAQPLHRALGIPATARLSLGVYSEKEDIDRLLACLRTARDQFSRA